MNYAKKILEEELEKVNKDWLMWKEDAEILTGKLDEATGEIVKLSIRMNELEEAISMFTPDPAQQVDIDNDRFGSVG
jgi:hypothetical protein